MALVGHISGSNQSQSTIGVTGSVVFADRPASLFPTLSGVGSDVVFFVSGAVGGKNVANQKSVAVFGGDAVVSGSLTIGTGSIKITSNDIQFGGLGNRIELNGTELKFFDVSNPSGYTLTSLASGGGGGGASFFSSVTAGEAFTTGSLVSSGSYTVKDGTGAAKVILATDGSITGSEAQLSSVNTAAATFNLANTATTLNLGTSSTTVNIGQASQAINVAGNLDVNGTSDLAGNVTLSGTGQTVTHSGGGNLTISSTGGNVLIEGSIFSGNDLTVLGSLTVNGPVVSIETTNLRVKDPLVLLNSGTSGPNAKSAIAFASGSTAATGATSLIFGALGSGNVLAAAQMDTLDGAETSSNITYATPVPIRASEFQVRADTARVTSGDGTTLVVTGTTTRIGSHGGVTEFAFAGSTTGVASSVGGFTVGSAAGTTLNLSGSNQFILNHGDAGVDFARHGLLYLEVTSGSNAFAPQSANLTSLTGGAQLGGTGAVVLSGSQVVANTTSGLTVQRHGTSIVTISSPDGTTANILQGSVGVVSANILNTNVTTLNLGGDATTLTVGGITTSTQTINVGTTSTGSSTYNFGTAATGNGFTRTINLGTGGVAGSTTNINLGNANGGTVTVNNNFSVNGNTTLGNATGDDITFTGQAASNLLPKTDSLYDLGSSTKRWANIYTGDLHLRNDRGSWTIIEEADFLTITNNRNGKRYKFVLEEIG